LSGAESNGVSWQLGMPLCCGIREGLLDASNEVIYETQPADIVLRHNRVLLGLYEAAIDCAQRGSPTELRIA